jgi:alpha-L-rhamnosidase
VDGLTYVKASHKSMYGEIRSHWRREANRIELDVTVPANTGATIFVPANNPAGVTESGVPAGKAKGVRFLRQQDGAAVFEIGSGTYSFAASAAN